jgi:hypothetical protein
MNSQEFTRETESDWNIVAEVDLVPQEIGLDDPSSRFRFDRREKQLVATRGALEEFGPGVIEFCIRVLRCRAEEHNGLDYLQVFLIGRDKKKLWFIEDAQVITALLPGDY